MWRVAAIALLLCAGCSSQGQDTLLQDSLWGDFRALFTGDEHPANPEMPGTAGYSSGLSSGQSRSATPGQ